MRIKPRNIKVGIVGAGLIGWKRADAIKAAHRGRLAAVADIDSSRAQELADKYGCDAYGDWRKLVKRADLDIVIVSVPNKFTSSIVIEALKRGRHVLCEKPVGRNSREARAVWEAVKKYKKILKVGFNHRFHSGVLLAKKLFDEGKIGKPMFIRARYGYGGRLGMEKEWRLKKGISGGGELLDQGVHIIDLVRWFVGDPEKIYGLTRTKFWKTKLDDNTFVIMENKNATAQFHVSSTNWKNIFSFEVFGTRGYLQVDGKGGSYGEESLTLGRRKPKFGVPDIKVFKFKGDLSWRREWENLLDAIFKNKKIIGDAYDGWQANRIVEAVYKSSKIGQPVVLRS